MASDDTKVALLTGITGQVSLHKLWKNFILASSNVSTLKINFLKFYYLQGILLGL